MVSSAATTQLGARRPPLSPTMRLSGYGPILQQRGLRLWGSSISSRMMTSRDSRPYRGRSGITLRRSLLRIRSFPRTTGHSQGKLLTRLVASWVMSWRLSAQSLSKRRRRAQYRISQLIKSYRMMLGLGWATCRCKHPKNTPQMLCQIRDIERAASMQVDRRKRGKKAPVALLMTHGNL